LDNILDIPWSKLKFLDEAHFTPKDLYKKLVVAPKGKSKKVVGVDKLDDRFSMVQLTSLTKLGSPCIIDINYDSNTQYDFVAFVLNCVNEGYLASGDYLILDNASIHHGSDTFEFLLRIASLHGFYIRFLPKYSPELNPCELVWSHVKRYVTNNRERGMDILDTVVDGFATVSKGLVYKFYHHCINTSQLPSSLH